MICFHPCVESLVDATSENEMNHGEPPRVNSKGSDASNGGYNKKPNGGFQPHGFIVSSDTCHAWKRWHLGVKPCTDSDGTKYRLL
jgi:hypothetical protein